MSTPELVGRTLLALGYAMLCMLGVAAVALFLSTVTESPLGAALGTMALLVASTLLLTLDAADPLRPYLPTRYWLAFVDLFRDPILWRDVLRGVLLQVVYVVVFLGAGLGQLHDQGHHGLSPGRGSPHRAVCSRQVSRPEGPDYPGRSRRRRARAGRAPTRRWR